MTIAILTTGGTFDKVYFDANSEYSIGEPCIPSILDEEMLHLIIGCNLSSKKIV